jgi:hypothetical protein
MAKKIKQVKSEEKLSLENIKVGDKILDLHDEEIEITGDLIEQMRQYEQETKKSVIWRGKITGRFLFYKWYEDNPQEKLKTKKKPGRKPKKVEELIEEEVVDEENELLDCIEDYKAEYNVKNVNTNSQKFKRFFYNWKQEK